MALFVYVNGSLIAVDRIRMRASGDQGVSGLSSAADGTMSQGGIVFEDPTYDLTVQGWMPVAVDEPDCTTAPRLFTGYVGVQNYDRGEHYRLDNDRQIDTTINDSNVLLSAPLFLTADSPNRPAETDTQRWAWLKNTDALAGKVYDLGFVTTGVEHYDANNYLHQSPADVLNDMCAARGNVFFTYWDQSAKKIGLFYDLPTATTFTCSLTFSNDNADIVYANGEPTGTCFPPYEGSVTVSDPSEVYCRVIYVYKGGTVVVHDQTTHDTFFAGTGQGIPAVGHRAILVENDKVGKATTATSFANRLLVHYSVERRQITFSTRLPAAKVGLVQAGMRVSLKFTQMPDLSTFQYRRIETVTIAPTEGDPTHYDLEITASVHGLSGGVPVGSGGGSTQPFPKNPPGTPVHFYSGTLLTVTESYGVADSLNIVGGSDSGWAPDGTLSSTGLGQITFFAGTTYNYTFTLATDPLDVAVGKEVGLGAGGVWKSPHIVDGTANQTWTGSFTPALTFTAGFVMTQAGFAHGHRGVIATWVIDPVGWDTGAGSGDPPQTGQWVFGETPTPAPGGGRVTFTTAYPFVDSSLRVWVDKVDETKALVSTDGATNSFTLAFDPRAYETILVDYQGI